MKLVMCPNRGVGVVGEIEVRVPLSVRALMRVTATRFECDVDGKRQMVVNVSAPVDQVSEALKLFGDQLIEAERVFLESIGGLIND